MSGAGAVLALLASALVAAAPAASDRPPQTATVRQGDVFVLRPPPVDGPVQSASLLGRSYPPLTVSGEAGPVFLMGVDLDAAPGEGSIILRRGGGREERRPIRIVRRAFPEERLSLPAALVTPPKELEERIAREQALAAEVYRSAGAKRSWDRGFAPPLDRKAAGNFGRRRILNGIPKSPHTGQDYSAPAGTPVRSVAGGTVRLARDFYYSGLTLFVDHGAGLVSVYMHLEELLVGEGDSIAPGQVIGKVGSTGRATGPHLHLGVRLFEQRVDPESLWGLFPNKR